MKVALFKSENEDGSPDKYVPHLKDQGIAAEIVPALQFDFKHLQALKSGLERPESFSGLIFTSPRCVNAVKLAKDPHVDLKSWRSKDNYSVGPATCDRVFLDLGLETQGKESGNAEQLSKIIIAKYEAQNNVLPFLLPCGNLKLGILEEKLREKSLTLFPVEVYETQKHKALESRLIEVLRENFDTFVFFSPSCFNFTIESLAGDALERFKERKLVAIGPSTKKAIEDKGFTVFRTAESPSPEGVLKALL